MNENIILSGFSTLDAETKGMVSAKAKDFFQEMARKKGKLTSLHMTLKVIHEREKSEKYEIMGKIQEGSRFHSATVIDRNPLTAVDDLLRKLATQHEHHG